MSNNEGSLINPRIIYKKINLEEGMKVGEFGCGRTGSFTFSASREIGERGTVYAMDILKDVLENIKNRSQFEGYHNVLTIWTDVEKKGAAGIPEKSLDVGFFVNIFFQLKNKEGALAEAERLIKNNGSLVVVDWSKKVNDSLGPDIDKMVDPELLIKMAKENNFILQENFPVGDYHFCLIFKKEERG
jgi:ubiquinone/menaquinone biosynthesis C-methylase UbiE